VRARTDMSAFACVLCGSNNMLYPQEDQVNKRLVYVCKFCGHKEPADDPCVSRTIIKHTAEYVRRHDPPRVAPLTSPSW
jgi:DNA-directed RNA polymerase subunit M/transcription elongation factor TFIIS